MEERAERAERTKNDGDIRMAILKTVAYADLFDFPLKAGEIQRYLHQVEADQIQVDRSLAALVGSESRLNQVDDYYMLPQRERIVETRRERTQTAAQLWPQALHYGHMLARFPYIRMVALTGALAVENAISEDDLDYFIVTEPGRVWLTRAFTLLLVRAEARRGITLCPNYFLSGSALALDQKNLYVAREITQMVPLSGRRVYNQLREQNLWTRDFLPNASGAPNEQAILDREVGWPSTHERTVVLWRARECA